MADEAVQLTDFQQQKVREIQLNAQRVQNMSAEALNQANESVFNCKFLIKNSIKF